MSISNPDDVRDRLSIDKAQLDEELMRQPELVFDVNMQHVEAMSTRDAARLKIRKVESAAKEKYAEEMNEAGEKVTAAGATAFAAGHKSVFKAQADHEKLIAAARRWEAACEAVKVRGMALHKIVDLELTQGAAIAGQSEGSDRRPRRQRVQDDSEAQRQLRNRKHQRSRRTRDI